MALQHRQGIEGSRVPFAHEHLLGIQAGQPPLQAAAGGQAAEPEHLGGGQGRVRGLQQEVVAPHAAELRLPPQAGEGIGEHGPAAPSLPANQGLQVPLPGLGAPPPGPGDHHAGTVGIEGGNGRGQGGRTERRSAGGGGRGGTSGPFGRSRRKRSGGERSGRGRGRLQGKGCSKGERPGQGGEGSGADVQGLLKGQVEVHRPGGKPSDPPEAPEIALDSQGLDSGGLHLPHP